jgi:threonine/homoserine/homoserine lactone efflux protein
MSLYGFAAFCAVYLLAVATPGPGVAAVLTRSLTHGMRGAPAFIAGFVIGDIHASQRPWRLFLGSLSLTLGNPKPMIFFVALLPTVVHLRALHFVDYLFIAAAITFIVPLVLGGHALAASRARRFLRKPSSIRLLNRGAGTAMAGAAFVVATQ